MTTQGLSLPVRGGTIATICACCGAMFLASNPKTAFCSSHCRKRAYYYRRRQRPIPPKGSAFLGHTQPIHVDVVSPAALNKTHASSDGLIPFAYEGRQVRVITDEQGIPWFVAADVCAVLELGNSRKAMERLDDDERGTASIATAGGLQSMTTVNEPGLYSLILGSRKPEARAFKRWVTHEVLPAIRRTGSYTLPAATHSTPQLPAMTPAPLPTGIHIVAPSPRAAASLWWEAIRGEVNGNLSRRLNPANRHDDALRASPYYSWQRSA